MTPVKETGRALTGSPAGKDYAALKRTKATKLSAEDVRGIRTRLGKGDTHQSIANDYHVCISTVGNISRGVTFSWVK